VDRFALESVIRLVVRRHVFARIQVRNGGGNDQG
jgi:hypothetical protein